MTGDETVGTDARQRMRWRRLFRMRRRGRVALALGIVLLALLAGLWMQRRPIAEGFVENALTARGVRARYVIDDIGFSTQRLRDVVIGDPANPDLVADWIEVHTRVGFGGASVTGLSAGRVRIAGRLVDGRLRLGEIDRLLPPPSGAPFSLPSITVAVEDAGMRLETPQGLLGLKLTGSGQLDDGFRGRIAAVGPRIEAGGCIAERATMVAAIRIDDAAPRIDGPLRAASLTCGEYRVRAPRIGIDVALGPQLDRWRGSAAIAASAIDLPLGGGRKVRGAVSFDGTAVRTSGTVRLSAGAFALPGGSGTGLSVGGRYVAGRESAFTGSIGADRATLAPVLTRALADAKGQGAGTPIGPIADALVDAGLAATRAMRLDAEVVGRVAGGAGNVRIVRLSADAESGARVVLAGGDGIAIGWPGGAPRIDGTLTIAGGRLPSATIALEQRAAGAPVTGIARIAPYAAGNARIALAPVRFERGGGGTTRIATEVTLSGPLGDGRVDALRLPVDAAWDGAGTLVVNRSCVPAGFDRLAIAGLVLDRAAATLCPEGRALVAIDRGNVSGGARIASARLAGSLGGTPLTLGLTDTVFRLADRGFTLAGVEARLGAPERVSRLDIARLDGRIDGAAVAGVFDGAGGQIANVPLVMSNAAGRWSLAGGTLALDGRLDVADAATGEDRRFEPLASEDFKLTLADGAIAATGTLIHPGKRVEVADVTIAHDLSAGAGRADLGVDGIVFGPDFQPNELTPVTFGVIADVVGIVRGRGQIRWSPDGVSSEGVFETPGTDLAAAFGPVTGIRGSIAFTDLLGIVSAPDQVATIAEVNPGIPVRDGRVTYRLLGNNRVEVEGGLWPFAGGTMTLEPTVLDFSGTAERRMTFRVAGVDAALFLQEFDFENLSATGTFDGVLPMVFDASGGRIVDGRLNVREGGGTIAYVGEVSKEDVGFWGNMAFDALKSLTYQNLELALAGPLSGEMVTSIRFSGVSQGEGTRSNFLIDRIARLPLVFNITIRAPFRQLLDSVRSYYDPSRLIERNLPALLEEQRRREQGLPPAAPAPAPGVPSVPTPGLPPPSPVQPSESENVP